MAKRAQKPGFPNPFNVIFLLSSTAFVVTALGYFVSPMVAQQAARPGGQGQGPAPGSLALAAWFDRNGPLALGIEIVAMLAFALLSMATDHWFTVKPRRDDTPAD
jgi:hypothetical protein